MKHIFIALAAALTLCGCVPTNTGSNLTLTASGDEPMVYARADGRFVSPAKVQLDKSVCEGHVTAATVDAPRISTEQKGVAALLDVGMQAADRQQTVNSLEKGCMAERGYILVPRSQAPSAKMRTAQR